MDSEGGQLLSAGLFHSFQKREEERDLVVLLEDREGLQELTLPLLEEHKKKEREQQAEEHMEQRLKIDVLENYSNPTSWNSGNDGNRRCRS